MFSSPFLRSSYYDPTEYYNPYSYEGRSLAHQRAIAQQRALDQQRRQKLQDRRWHRSQYLPNDDDDNDEESDDEYSARQRLYLDGLRSQQALERKRREEEIHEQRRLEAARREAVLREQEERRIHQLREAYQHRQQAPEHPPASSPSHSSYRAPFQTPASPPPMTERIPTPPPLSQPTSEERETAATKIQTAFRVHQALRTLKDLENQFDTSRQTFSLPTTIDFQGPDGIVTISSVDPLPHNVPDTTTVPKLAFNATNYHLHSYVESLNRLLLKLDGVESWGDATVRKMRRRVVGRVEAEANRLESHWKTAWTAHVAGGEQESEQQEVEDQLMEEENDSSDEDDFQDASEDVPERETTEHDASVVIH